jgi:adenine-specific DNA-methyltransferase
MPVKYIPYYPNTVQGQAILDNITRTRRILRYRDNDKVYERIKRGMPYYELEKIESVGNNPENMLIRGECISACAYLKDKGIKVDLFYVDPPFASGADYAKKVYIRKNPKIASAIAKAEEEMELEEFRAFEEKMYGDIWNKEDYLNWMYENLIAIKSVMSETASIYVHLDWHIGHYVKVLMDEVFGEDNFINEVVWKYIKYQMRKMNRFANNTDRLLIYSNSENYNFTPQAMKLSTPKKLLMKGWDKEKGVIANIKDENGKTQKISVFDETIDDLWNIPFIGATSGERTDYATQKPKALLERVINASSYEGMIIADFFGGSGVTAKVAHDSKRKFIHCDVGINSIQTTRDRLVAAGAEFDIYDIQDGVSLFRNPVQTMDKMKSLITGLKNEDALDSFWEGGIQDSKLGLVPVYVPNLLDHSTKVLDIPLINRIINEAMPDLPDGTKQVIVFYVDIENETELKKFISEYNATGIDIVLRDLKSILDDVVINDEIDYKMKKSKTGFEIEIKSFTSDRLIQKIDAFNQKKSLNGSKKDLFEENGEENGDENEEGNGNGKKKKSFVPIAISKNGLELIELISLDCTSKDGIWKSDCELKIDKNGYVILNGKKTKEFWNAKIVSEKKPLRLKVRNIAGDESVIVL